MNKTAKVILITGLSILLVGLMLGLAGFFMVAREIRTGVYGAVKDVLSGKLDEGQNFVSDRSALYFERTIEDSFHSLRIESGVSDLSIEKSATSRSYLQVHGLREEEYVTRVSGGTLILEEKINKSWWPGVHIGPLHVGSNGVTIDSGLDTDISVVLYLPMDQLKDLHLVLGVGSTEMEMPLSVGEIHLEQGVGDFSAKNLSADELEASCGVGQLKLTDCSVKELDLDCGVGDVSLTRLSVEEEATISGGVGRILLEDVLLNDARLELGVGDTKLTGTLKGECRVEQGMGSVDILLVNPSEAFYLQVDNGVGDVSCYVGGQKISESSMGGDWNLGRYDAADRLYVEGGVGSLHVELP